MTVSELIEQFNKLNMGAGSFLQNLLAAQCFLGQAIGGAILHIDPKNKIDILALYPQIKNDTQMPEWLSSAMSYAHELIQSEETIVKPFKQNNPSFEKPVKSHIVLTPVMIPDIGKTIASFLLADDDEEILEMNVQKLRLSTGILNYSQSNTIQQSWQQNCIRLKQAMETLSAINQQKKFTHIPAVFSVKDLQRRNDPALAGIVVRPPGG